MKKVLTLVIAVILLLSVMTPVAWAASADAGITVYVSVSADGKLLIAAQPVTITDKTAQGVIKAAHEEFYSGGLSGYVAGIDPMWNMYLVTKCWGVQATPFIIVNDAPLGATPGAPATVDVVAVAANDNIIICTSSDAMNKPATPVSLKSTLSGDSATVTATSWVLDFMTFTYSHGPLANANVVDSTNASLGKTDSNGSITVTVPADGIVAIEGLAAINVKAVPATPTTTTGPTTPPEGTISYKDAKNYIGQTVTIEAQVFEKVDAGDFWVLFLGGPSTDANAVGIEVKKTDVSKFPDDLYVGKTVRITGELHTNPVGGASFSLTDPSQIQVVSAPATTTTAASTTAAGQDLPLFYGPTITLIIVGFVILVPIAVVVIVKMVRQSRIDKPAAASKKK